LQAAAAERGTNLPDGAARGAWRQHVFAIRRSPSFGSAFHRTENSSLRWRDAVTEFMKYESGRESGAEETI